MPKPHSKRYTPRQRARILGAIEAKGLTVAAAAKRFRVSEPTIYAWRANGTKRATSTKTVSEAELRAEIVQTVRKAVAKAIARELSA